MKKHCSNCARYQAMQTPRNNCEGCWNKYFLSHQNYVAFDINAMERLGRDNLIKLRGEKYVQQLDRFTEANNLIQLYRSGQLNG